MPRATRTRRSGVRLGRPPRADSGNWEKFYVLLKTDVAAYVRAKSQEDGNSLSKIIGDLVSEGVAHRLEREQTQPEQVL